jgi:hypothetical protein
MLEQGAETRHPVDISDKIGQPDRRHDRSYAFGEGHGRLGFSIPDGWHAKTLRADPRIAPSCFQPMGCLAQLAIEHLRFLLQVSLDIDRNGNRDPGFSLDNGERRLRNHMFIKRTVGARTLDPYLTGGNAVLQLDDQEQLQHLAIDRAIRGDDFLSPASVRQSESFCDPRLCCRSAAFPCLLQLRDGVEKKGVLTAPLER